MHTPWYQKRKRLRGEFVQEHHNEPPSEALDAAKLIAAAPDLLAACEAYLKSNTMQQADKADEMIRAAVAKAKGEA